MDFTKSLLANIEMVKQEMNKEIISTTQELFNKVVDYSPTQVEAIYPGVWATGLFANSWQVGVNQIDSTVGASADESASASKSKIQGLSSLKEFMYNDGFISFTNNLDYADRVEYLGWNVTGPYAPVRQGITYIMGAKKV